MPICPAEGCRQPILEKHATLKLSPGTLQRGKKTGLLYHSATFEEAILIHYECVFRYFHPMADSEMYDIFRKRVETDVCKEKIDDLKNEAYLEAANDLNTLCAECLNEKTQDPDTPPEEYECKCGSAAIPICPDCGETTDLVDPAPVAEEDEEPRFMRVG
jgi:hypothetical protein